MRKRVEARNLRQTEGPLWYLSAPGVRLARCAAVAWASPWPANRWALSAARRRLVPAAGDRSRRDSWRADTQLLVDVCQSFGVEPAVERSRSGNGAHVWFFFTDPVPAADARRLGFAILTGAMARGAAVGVGSYDRLFPSQDVLPSGGFGNLIALPLQRNARQHGNTEFLDQQLKPYPDQWRYLASIRKITPDRLAELTRHADGDRALAVRPADDQRDPPWRPPRTLRERLAETRLPEQVGATIADRLYIDRSGLPPALAHAL
jgi:hypothetical protein